MSVYTPDRWVVVEINLKNDSIQKVLAGWSGGYTWGESWKLSSGITEVTEYDDRYEFLNHSGSTYVCPKTSQGFSGYIAGIFANFERELGDRGSIRILQEDEFKKDHK
jgi:hypothetical protein